MSKSDPTGLDPNAQRDTDDHDPFAINIGSAAGKPGQLMARLGSQTYKISVAMSISLAANGSHFSSEAAGTTLDAIKSITSNFSKDNIQKASLWSSNKAVPFKDDHHQQVMNPQGGPMMRPSDVDPHFFVDMGEATRTLLGLPTAAGPAGLLMFDRGGPWDTQRVGGSKTFNGQFTDFANVAIGLYASAARVPSWFTLSAADYKARSSNYGSDSGRDPSYSHLSARDGSDIRLGYSLYNTGGIGHSP
jgi:hypothetical protein